MPNEGVSSANVGDRASVRGTLDVLDGEAVIYASTVTPEATLDSIPPVFTMWDTPNAVPIRVIRPNFLEVEH